LDNIDRVTIEGFENYEVDYLGNVFSKTRVMLTPNNPNMVYRTVRARKLQKMVGVRGYEYVTLYSNRTQKRATVHRLIAAAFIFKPENTDIVNHIDNNPTNNKADNLEWVTQYDNIRHSIQQGRHSSQGKHRYKEVIHLETGLIYASITIASKAFGYKSTSTLIHHLKGRTKVQKWEVYYS